MPTDKGDPDVVIRRAGAARTVARTTHRLLVVYESLPRPEVTLPPSASIRLPELRTALAQGGLILQYQPYLECASGRWVRAEALVRWPHPTAGLLPPGAFLPLAEAGGMMRRLDQWVLNEACRQAAAWRGAGHLIQVAINASSASINDPEYASTVLRALARHRLPGAAIEIEFTEESAFHGSDVRLGTLADELGALGVTLALDDFGTGDSSLLRLRDLPVETVKIDRSFVINVLTDPRDAAIIETVVTLAHRLDHKVVAEGIEDADTLKYLAAIGVDYIQGYFVCRPVAPETLIERLPQGRAEGRIVPFAARTAAA
jgi:EAL domain-containing protein (putative c-di-GMP-specific phosphodiesterase class I)